MTNELVVYNTGTLTLDGGTIETATFDVVSPNDFKFNTGTLRFTGAKTLSATSVGQIFNDSSNPTLVADQRLDVDGIATISTALRLNGGTLSVGSATQASLANVDWDAGTLQITNQTLTVSPAGQLGLSIVIDSDETLNVPTTGAAIDVQSGADLNVLRGGLHSAQTINSGLIVVSNTVDVDFDADNDGSGLTNDGDLVAIDSTIAGPVMNNGSLEIVGAVSFVDSVSLSASSVLGIDLDGELDFDSIFVDGDLSLDGSLAIDANEMALAAGQSFEILDVGGSLSGAFAGLADNSLVGSFGGVELFIDYDGGDGNDVVLFTGGVDVDLDDDGDVDGADFLALQRVNPALIPSWESQFGSGLPAAAAAGNVPEPSSTLLVVAAWALIASARRTRFSSY